MHVSEMVNETNERNLNAMIKLQTATMRNAIARAKQIRPTVKMIGERTFTVSGSTGNTYIVKFSIINNVRFGECNCTAGQRNQMCFHQASAAAVQIAVASMRQAVKQPA
jgi:hypothetical protein